MGARSSLSARATIPHRQPHPAINVITPSATSSYQGDHMEAGHGPNPGMGSRRDTPSFAPSRRASKALALGAAENETTLHQAIDDVYRDIHANTAIAPLSSYTKTWIEFHQAAAMRTDIDPLPLPLTVQKIFVVAALFKAGRYRAFRNYAEAMKQEHMIDYEWSTRLQKAIKDATRSVTRGIGPSRQSGAIDIFLVFTLFGSALNSPVVPGGPIGAVNLIILGAFFLLREIESSLALAKNVTLDVNAKKVTWVLPASKTDVLGLGKSRTWGCICDQKTKTPCPFCTAKNQLALLWQQFGSNGQIPADLPMFPDTKGNIVSKESVVATLEEVANRLEIPTTSADGHKLLGGHTMRVSGAQHLARIGIELSVIALLARWQSEIVLRYAAEAPLDNITESYKEKLQQFNFKRFLREVQSEIKTAKDQFASLQEEHKKAIEEEIKISLTKQQVTQPTTSSNAEATTYYIRNDESGVHHKPYNHGIAIQPLLWTTKCGWKFGFSNFTIEQSLQDVRAKHMCSACLSKERREKRTEETSSESPSEASSSSDD